MDTQQPNKRMPSRRLRAVGAIVLVLALLLGLSQAFLPGLVASQLRANFKGYYSGVRFTVAATPALKLLLGRADRVFLDADVLRPYGQVNVNQLISGAENTPTVDATIRRMITPKGELDNLTLHKRGANFTSTVSVSRAALSGALPAGVTLLGTGGPQQTLTVAAHGKLLGHTLSATAALLARAGKIVLVTNQPFFPAFTIFSQPKISIDSLHVFSRGSDLLFVVQGRVY